MKSAKDFKTGLIYKYTSPNGKIYIGQTINEKARRTSHRRSARVEGKSFFARALAKYGFENFTYTVLIKFNPTCDIKKLKRVLNKLEQRYIKLYDSSNPELGYNLTTGGDSDYVVSDEVREKLSELKKDYIKENGVQDYMLNNLKKGWGSTKPRGPHSEETKKKMSAARKNKKMVEQYDLELNLINTFGSIADAARSIENESTLKTRSNRISECINGKWKSAYGFIWVRKK